MGFLDNVMDKEKKLLNKAARMLEKGQKFDWTDKLRAYDKHYMRAYRLNPGKFHKAVIRLWEGKFKHPWKKLKITCEYSIGKRQAGFGGVKCWLGTVASNTIIIEKKK